MLGHHGDDPAGGPHRRPRHPGPRRGTPRLRRGGRRVIQVHRQGALTAVSRHRRMPAHLLQIPEHPRPAARSPRSLNRGNPNACTASTAMPSPIRPNSAGSTSRPAVASPGNHDHGQVGALTAPPGRPTSPQPARRSRSAGRHPAAPGLRDAPATTCAAVSTRPGPTRYPDPREPSPPGPRSTTSWATRQDSAVTPSPPASSTTRLGRLSLPRPPRRPRSAPMRACRPDPAEPGYRPASAPA